MAGGKLSYTLLYFAILCLLFPNGGTAKTFSVSSSEDAPDLNPGDGLCVAYLIIIPPFVVPFCTLRAAVEETNSLAGEDEIVLLAATYELGVEGTGEEWAATGDLDIRDSVTISGRGVKETIISGGGLDRIFDVHGSADRVTIRDLSLQNGKILSASGQGGAIRNSASLTLTGVVVSENYGDGTSGIYNEGSCRLQRCSVFLNESGKGGVLWNGTGGTMRLEQTTLRHNLSMSGAYLVNRGFLSLVNSTVSNNGTASGVEAQTIIENRGEMEIVQTTVAENGKSSKGFVGLQNFGELTMVNSLIASHGGQDCQLLSPLTSLGGNLDSDASCGLDGKRDLSGVDPLLGPLGEGGGPTWSHLFSFASPLVDNGMDLSQKGIVVDQRGKKRPRGKGYDIGAVERQLSTIVPLLVPLLL